MSNSYTSLLLSSVRNRVALALSPFREHQTYGMIDTRTCSGRAPGDIMELARSAEALVSATEAVIKLIESSGVRGVAGTSAPPPSPPPGVKVDDSFRRKLEQLQALARLRPEERGNDARVNEARAAAYLLVQMVLDHGFEVTVAPSRGA